jgi:hypothetical protein
MGRRAEAEEIILKAAKVKTKDNLKMVKHFYSYMKIVVLRILYSPLTCTHSHTHFVLTLLLHLLL